MGYAGIRLCLGDFASTYVAPARDASPTRFPVAQSGTSRNCLRERPLTAFNLAPITASVKRSARDKRTGLSSCHSIIANCLRSTRISRSFSCSDNRPIWSNSSSVENTCLTTAQTICPRFQFIAQASILPAAIRLICGVFPVDGVF